MKALSFAELAEAQAAFALAENLAFRCHACHRVHWRQSKGWMQCVAQQEKKWGLRSGRWTEGTVFLRAEAGRAWWPSPAEYLAAQKMPWDEGKKQVGEEQPPLCGGPVPGVTWPLLLSLEAGVAQAVIREAWDDWWRRVEEFIRDTAERLRRACGRLEPREGFDPRGVQVDEVLAKLAFDRPNDGGPANPKLLAVGKQAVVKSNSPSRLGLYHVVVRFYVWGCRVWVRYPAVLHEISAARDLNWFLAAAGG